MKKILYIITLVIALLPVKNIFSQDDEEYIIAGANGALYIPSGTLHDRFKSTVGESFYLGKSVGDGWSWVGKFEYFKYDKLNEDKLHITRNVTVNDVDTRFEIPLPKLKMSLQVVGLSANAGYEIFNNGTLKTDLEFGFGIYRWFNKRGAYYDSLSVDTGKGNLALAQVLEVPEKNQVDWSGGLNFGVGVSVKVYKPIWFYASVNYKLVIGELWPALDLDLENVSTFQMYEIKAGFRAQF
jgi:hypothetical protein